MKKETSIFKEDLILTGNLITNFFMTALNTLQIAFFLQDTILYQSIILISTIIEIIINVTIIKKDNTTRYEKFYNHKNTLFKLEIIANLVLIPFLFLFTERNALIVMAIINILMTPFNSIQAINIKLMIAKNFSNNRRTIHDLYMQKYTSIINVIAIAAGYLANTYLKANIAIVIILIIESINNIFYMAQKPLGDDE